MSKFDSNLKLSLSGTLLIVSGTGMTFIQSTVENVNTEAAGVSAADLTGYTCLTLPPPVHSLTCIAFMPSPRKNEKTSTSIVPIQACIGMDFG